MQQQNKQGAVLWTKIHYFDFDMCTYQIFFIYKSYQVRHNLLRTYTPLIIEKLALCGLVKD